MSVLTTDSDGNLETEWIVWNKIITNWSMYIKKKPQWIRVSRQERKIRYIHAFVN